MNHALFAVVMEREQLAALRAGLFAIRGMLSPNVDPLLRDVQLDSAHGPRLFDAQQMTIQLGVLHPPRPPCLRRQPTRIAEEPKKESPALLFPSRAPLKRS